jgi:hypothetical protein
MKWRENEMKEERKLEKAENENRNNESAKI